jgi:hypothetical protein
MTPLVEQSRELKVARWHLICTADTHPDGMADSPWDHVCGCITSVWEQEPGKPTIDFNTTPEMVAMLREAISHA